MMDNHTTLSATQNPFPFFFKKNHRQPGTIAGYAVVIVPTAYADAGFAG